MNSASIRERRTILSSLNTTVKTQPVRGNCETSVCLYRSFVYAVANPTVIKMFLLDYCCFAKEWNLIINEI